MPGFYCVAANASHNRCTSLDKSTKIHGPDNRFWHSREASLSSLFIDSRQENPAVSLPSIAGENWSRNKSIEHSTLAEGMPCDAASRRNVIVTRCTGRHSLAREILKRHKDYSPMPRNDLSVQNGTTPRMRFGRPRRKRQRSSVRPIRIGMVRLGSIIST
ncbi:hypothetical protein BKA81DRAFT_35120 [Phyllosticta paracitricarpa]